MREVSKLSTDQNPGKLSLKKVKKEVTNGIPYATQKLNYILHHNK